jgi:hypothetical protein
MVHGVAEPYRDSNGIPFFFCDGHGQLFFFRNTHIISLS